MKILRKTLRWQFMGRMKKKDIAGRIKHYGVE